MRRRTGPNRRTQLEGIDLFRRRFALLAGGEWLYDDPDERLEFARSQLEWLREKCANRSLLLRPPAIVVLHPELAAEIVDARTDER